MDLWPDKNDFIFEHFDAGREKEQKIIDTCKDIMKSLPEYFSENGLELFEKDVAIDHLIVSKNKNDILGLITLKKHYAETYEVSWMAVKRGFYREGIGTSLIDESVKFVKSKGAKLLMVKTLAETVEYEPYEKTRKFYESNGFIPEQIIKNYPGWEPSDDCKIYIKII